MLLRILNILTAEIESESIEETQKSIEISMNNGSNAKDRYPCKIITVTVREYLARTEIEFKPQRGEKRIEKFICADRDKIYRLIAEKSPAGSVTAKCDVDIDFNGRNEAITLSIITERQNSLIFYRFMEPAKSAEFVDPMKSKMWNRRVKIVEMMQSPNKHYKKTDILGFLDDWFSGLSMDEKQVCFQYIYTNINFIPEPDNARDMLISYSLTHDFYNLIFIYENMIH